MIAQGLSEQGQVGSSGPLEFISPLFRWELVEFRVHFLCGRGSWQRMRPGLVDDLRQGFRLQAQRGPLQVRTSREIFR